MSKEDSEKLLTNETEPANKDIEKINIGNDDDFQGYSKFSKFMLFFLFFWLGIINHLGTILVMNGGRLLAFELGMKEYLQIYTSVSTIFSVLTRLINSKLCLKVSYKKRIIILCFWMMAGYLSMYAVLELHSTVLDGYNVLCFVLSFIPCFFLGSSYAFGEAAMVAYLRLFPKTLISGWSSGTGLSGLLSGALNLTSQLIDGFSLKYLYLILFPVGFVYLLLFICTFRILKSQERKIEREERLSQARMSIMRDSSMQNSKGEESNNEPVGRVIINLGLIYFLQFFCVNTLIVRACDRRDIDFLPTGCSDSHKKYRKGKFEFINLAYQLGMFLSKTFIKIVRKIQPIEIYTISIIVVNILYIIEYYTGFLSHWGVFLGIGLILGFFSGGTYAGGFYTILNSDRVHKDYKELTVNIATIFNDSGTFISGLIGFVAYNYIFDDAGDNLGYCE